MLMTCREPGCTTIVMGRGRCVSHEPHESRVFLRGRPFMSELPTGVRTGHEGAFAVAASHSRHTTERHTGYTTFEHHRE